MTEAQWLASNDAWPMLEFLNGIHSARKARLFACACYQNVHEPLTPKDKLTVELGEAFADGTVSKERVKGLIQWPNCPDWDVPFEELCGTPDYVGHNLGEDEVMSGPPEEWEVFGRLLESEMKRERAAQAQLARCIFGNPFRRAIIKGVWRSTAVVALARTIYDKRAFDRIPELADALTNAGCDDTDILAHCRVSGPHVRGCWVVDLLLGNK